MVNLRASRGKHHLKQIFKPPEKIHSITQESILEKEQKSPAKIYACDFPGCKAAFSKPCRLDYHIRVHDDQRPFKCDFPGCAASYTRPYHLTRHRNKNHTKIVKDMAVFKCTITGCEQILQTKQYLDRHVASYHEGRPFACDICQKRFHKHSHLTKHGYEHTKVFPYVCSVNNCNKGFTTKQHLERHQKIHAGYKCPLGGCNEVFDKWSLLRKHRAAVHGKRHACKICGKDFPRLRFLTEHLVTHKNERECRKCPDCESLLVNTEKAWAQHSTRCIAKRPQLICQFPGCGKIFFRTGDLSRHGRTTHSKGVNECSSAFAGES